MWHNAKQSLSDCASLALVLHFTREIRIKIYVQPFVFTSSFSIIVLFKIVYLDIDSHLSATRLAIWYEMRYIAVNLNPLHSHDYWWHSFIHITQHILENGVIYALYYTYLAKQLKSKA